MNNEAGVEPISQEVSIFNDTNKCHFEEWSTGWSLTANKLSWNPNPKMLLPSGYRKDLVICKPGRNSKSYPRLEVKAVFRRNYIIYWIQKKLIDNLECLSEEQVLELVKEAYAQKEATTETLPGPWAIEATTQGSGGDSIPE